MGIMTLWHRVRVWAWVCCDAWRMLGNVSESEPQGERPRFEVTVTVDGDSEPSAINPRYVLKPNAAIVDIGRNLRVGEIGEVHGTIVLAYGQDAPLRVIAWPR